MMHLHGEASSNAGSQLSKNSGLRKKFKSEITPIEMVKELQQDQREKQADNVSQGGKGDKVPTMLELVEEEDQENPVPNPQKTPTMQELIT